MAVGRIHRLLRLIILLQADEAKGVDDFLEELGISRRTFFRDLKMLEAAGIPYYHDRKAGGYRIARTFFLPPINLDVPETLGLMLMAKYATAQRGAPMSGPALSAIFKLVTAVPEPMRAACAELMSNVSIDPGPQPKRGRSSVGGPADGVGDESRWFLELQRSVDEQRVCEITYKSPVEVDAIATEIKPYALHFAHRAWYVFAFSAVHKEVRIFKLQRITKLRRLARGFKRPSEFKIEDKISAAWQLIPEGKLHKIELEFSPKVATNVGEVIWHRSQRSEMLPDGRCRMTFEVDGLGEIAWWICGYGDQVVVIKPAALRRRVREMHVAAIEKGT